jgi:hypothetical protein
MDEIPRARMCPQCSRPLPPAAETCQNCGRDEANPFTAPSTSTEQPTVTAKEPSLVTAILIATLVSLLITFLLRGLGILFGLVLVPAVIRAAAVLKRQRTSDSPAVRESGYSHALMASIAVMFLIWLASAIAFAAVCTPVALVALSIDPNGKATEAFAFGLGGVAGSAAFLWFTRQFWPGAKDDDATA